MSNFKFQQNEAVRGWDTNDQITARLSGCNCRPLVSQSGGGGSTDIEWGRRQGTHWRLQYIL